MPEYKNVVAGVSNTTGTDDFVVSGAALPSSLALEDVLTDGEVYGYMAYYADGVTDGVEVGTGAWTLATTTMARTTVESSSNAGAKVVWAGELVVEIVLTAAQITALASTQYFIAHSTASAMYGTLSGAINGVNTEYTVPEGSYKSGKMMVYKNGQPTLEFVETTPASGIFNMNVAPKSSGAIPDVLMVTYYV
jgi:hypothetical protein